MTPQEKAARKQQGRDYTLTCIAVLLIVTSFFSIYNYAQKSQPGNAVWAGISLLAGGLLLATQLAAMRNRKR